MNTPSIDVHGMTREEALEVIRLNLRSFYDQGFPDVTIIHGHGKGILRTYIRDILRNVPYIRKIRSASNNGATIAIFSD